ncbi:hypothetical protein TNCV_2355111 [Trichonephila clavipes]|nr:hypothetical protein TNCV_2355111 [Trichonephila clavipes]
MVSLGHPSLPPTDLGGLDDEEATPGIVCCDSNDVEFRRLNVAGCPRANGSRGELPSHIIIVIFPGD